MERMRRIAIALLLSFTVLAVAAAPGSARDRTRYTQYKVTKAEGRVRATFHGDEAAGCRERGVCGVSGTVTYSFGGKPDFADLTWIREGTETIFIVGLVETRGATVSDVTTAGSAERCVDRVGHRYEQLAFEPRRGRLRFTWHGLEENGEENGEEQADGDFGVDPFDTHCAGPSVVDAARAGALPVADVPFRLFRSKRSTLTIRDTKPFAGGGFAGTVEWDLRYRWAWRKCNPRCFEGGGILISG